ncbi:hypothetical protein LINGRAHAP2_LOCUS29432 [Linum grandiflorum]
MVLLCFELNLCSLSRSSLADLKQFGGLMMIADCDQCLLQLANYYAISSSQRGKPDCVGDRIGLCYAFNDRSSSSIELKVAYSPIGDFRLRDFHQAVNNLPTESLRPDIGDSDTICCCADMKLSSILNDQALYSWGGRDVKRKLIVLSSHFPRTVEDADKKLLTTCRCHGTQLHQVANERVETLSCPDTASILGAFDVIANSVRIGEKSPMKPEQVSRPIEFNLIQRTNLTTFNEGVIVGSPYIVTPANYHKIGISSSEEDLPDFNAQAFRGVCHALHSMDQGLICSSYYNLRTMAVAAFNCFYILLPSENGPMLLRRLLGSEEVLPMPDLDQVASPSITPDIQSSIQDVLLKIESSDYNPLMHERGFHQKLNSLVNESLQFRSIPPPKVDAGPPQLGSINPPDSSEAIDFSDAELEAIILEEENLKMSLTARDDGKNTPSISEEWEQLVVLEAPNMRSPTCSISKPRINEVLSDGIKQLDAKTSRILERLEVPRQLKAKAKNNNSATPTVYGSSSISERTKRPLVPFRPIEQPSTSTQLMKPTFQRPKRKLR